MKKAKVLLIACFIIAIGSAFTTRHASSNSTFQVRGYGDVAGIACADLLIDNNWDCSREAEGEVCTVTTLAGTVPAYYDYIGCENEWEENLLKRNP
ncbi:DUF6520 family protein [Pedobacter frigoris]|uniref:Uncharacterized protein n=1 Tax=Pedobacter frigoris TaxID=2571272 RepID=A0A4U1CNB5_9SPHI|nr:DUF6520 family protein [Pedobacter frigoris]TKC08984.1 hypothetical protein FA047_02495 [Pedobacter frigoris]